MAIGIARLFGIRLPLNFASPYKAANIIEFWRRWHMTLSRFLRDYLYIPLGGNRHGNICRYRSLILTMLLGGLWHGAGWTFVLWGGIHGAYLVINHGWHLVQRRTLLNSYAGTAATRFLGWALTFVSVVIAWVFFRANSVASAMSLLEAMTGANGAVLDVRLATVLAPLSSIVTFEGTGVGSFGSVRGFLWIGVLAAIAWLAPNTQQIMYRIGPALEIYPGEISAGRAKWLIWKPTVSWAIAGSVVTVVALAHLTRVQEFLYFQF
jgi:hypothetical protein